MVKVIITGSNGLLGQKLIYALCKKNSVKKSYEIFACSRGENRLLKKDNYAFVSLDISDAKDVEKVFSRVKPDFVIHTAAMTNVDACETDPEACRLNNIVAVENIVRTLEQLQQQEEKYHPQLIHLSTDFIFDGKSGPYREEDDPAPVSIYGHSKLQAEKIVQASALKWCILRTIIVYGLVDGMSRSNLVLWAIEALKKGKPITVVNDQFRSPTLAEDLAEGCLLAMEKSAQGVYNISGSGLYSVLALVQLVAKEFQLNPSLIQPISSEQLKQPAKRPPKTGFHLEKAIRELGYKPKSFEEGLKIFRLQLEEKGIV
jgi:dTDP-4-dehydrorhamnose reductase